VRQDRRPVRSTEHYENVNLLSGSGLAALMTLPGIGEKRAVTLATRFATGYPG